MACDYQLWPGGVPFHMVVGRGWVLEFNDYFLYGSSQNILE